jgi:hypothetical protein
MREGEEGVANVEDVVDVVVAEEDDVVEVTVAEEEDGDGPIKVILVPDSPPTQSAYKQTSLARIGPWGRPTGTIAPRMSGREASQDPPETGFAVWPPPPPSGQVTTMPPPPSSSTSSTVRSYRHK